MSRFYCTCCNADLESQYGFDPNASHWYCTQCGTLLTNPNGNAGARFEDVVWLCDNCGACLNDQPGFTDWGGSWRCTKCGHTNGTTEDDIFSSEEEYQAYRSSSGYCCDDSERDEYDEYDKYDEDRPDETEADNSYEESQYQKSYSSFNFKDCWAEIQLERERRKTEVLRQKEAQRKERLEFISAHWKGLLILVVSFIIGGIVISAVSERKNWITIGVSSTKIEGMHYEDVAHRLENAGFTNITVEAKQDLNMRRISEQDTVDEVFISGDNSFSSTDKFRNDAKIVIIYHSAKMISIPFSSKDIKGKDYQDILAELKRAGFENIRTEENPDLVTGWLNFDGEIDTFTIDGEKKFKSGQVFRIDAEIVIVYHTFKTK